MNAREIPIVILLDLGTDNRTTALDVTELIPGQPEVKHQLRATQFGAPESPTGSPDNEADWALCTAALIRLADEAKRQAETVRTIGTQVRFWIAGNAGLPVFYLFGHLMSRWTGAITLVHKEGSTPVRLALEPAPGDFFDVVHEGDVTAQGAVALSVSCRNILDRDAVHAYQAVEGLAFTSNVTLHIDESMTEANFGSAVRQLDEIARGLPARTIAVFIRAPTPLAFALGRAINPRTVGSITVPSFDLHSDRRAYRPAIRLPLPRVAPVPHPHTLLFLAASPRPSTPLDLTREPLELKHERDAIEQAIRRVQGGEQRLRLVPHMGVDPDELVDHLHEHQPAILHFSGHGNSHGIVVETDVGDHTTIHPGALANVIKREAPETRLVVLSACHSQTSVAALLQVVRCVISMSDRIDDTAARDFATALYRAIALDRPFETAFNDAKDRLDMKRIADSDVPRIDFASEDDRSTLSVCSLACRSSSS
jgi:hypothetical protein